jgi:hypothetical protein
VNVGIAMDMVLLFISGYFLCKPWFFKGLTPKTPVKELACEFTIGRVIPQLWRKCKGKRKLVIFII